MNSANHAKNVAGNINLKNIYFTFILFLQSGYPSINGSGQFSPSFGLKKTNKKKTIILKKKGGGVFVVSQFQEVNINVITAAMCKKTEVSFYVGIIT